MDIDIYDTIDNIYKLPLASKEALLSNQANMRRYNSFNNFVLLRLDV